MKRNTLSIVILIIIAITSPCISLIMHEFGHFLTSICLGIPIDKISFGVQLYVRINVMNSSNLKIALVALGSIIVPEIIYVILIMFKNFHITAFRVLTAVSLYVHIFLSIFVLLFGTEEPETYDILIFQNYTGLNSISIIIWLVILLLLNVAIEIRTKRIKEMLELILELGG